MHQDGAILSVYSSNSTLWFWGMEIKTGGRKELNIKLLIFKTEAFIVILEVKLIGKLRSDHIRKWYWLDYKETILRLVYYEKQNTWLGYLQNGQQSHYSKVFRSKASLKQIGFKLRKNSQKKLLKYINAVLRQRNCLNLLHN